MDAPIKTPPPTPVEFLHQLLVISMCLGTFAVIIYMLGYPTKPVTPEPSEYVGGGASVCDLIGPVIAGDRHQLYRCDLVEHTCFVTTMPGQAPSALDCFAK